MGNKINRLNKIKNVGRKRNGKKRISMITSMFSTHRDKLPGDAFKKLNRA